MEWGVDAVSRPFLGWAARDVLSEKSAGPHLGNLGVPFWLSQLREGTVPSPQWVWAWGAAVYMTAPLAKCHPAPGVSSAAVLCLCRHATSTASWEKFLERGKKK